MKIIITMILSALFIVASSGTTAEEGLMKAVDKVDNNSKPLISVSKTDHAVRAKHIRELHGDINSSRILRTKAVKHERRLAKFKENLRKQKQARLSGLASSKVTTAY